MCGTRFDDSLQFEKPLLEVDDEISLPLLQHAVSLGFEPAFQIGDAAGVFGIELAPRFERPPVGRDAIFE
jgi:hypothetical protein